MIHYSALYNPRVNAFKFHLAQVCWGRLLSISQSPVLVLLCVYMVAYCGPFGFKARGGMRIASASTMICYF